MVVSKDPEMKKNFKFNVLLVYVTQSVSTPGKLRHCLTAVSSIYIWSENSRPKSEAKMPEIDVQCQSLSIVFVCAVNTN